MPALFFSVVFFRLSQIFYDKFGTGKAKLKNINKIFLYLKPNKTSMLDITIEEITTSEFVTVSQHAIIFCFNSVYFLITSFIGCHI